MPLLAVSMIMKIIGHIVNSCFLLRKVQNNWYLRVKSLEFDYKALRPRGKMKKRAAKSARATRSIQNRSLALIV